MTKRRLVNIDVPDEATLKQYEQEYQKYLERQANLGIIHYKFQRKSRKTHFCGICGCEIHKNEYAWWFKPHPVNHRNGTVEWFKWRVRCIEHEPKRYNETDNFDENGNELYNYEPLW